MRLNINLASRPYQDVRLFYTRWGTALGVAAVVTALLVYLAVVGWLDSQDVRQRLRETREQIARLEQERAAAEVILNQPENRQVRDRARFLNAQIARKAFSWTQVFSDLERLMPARLQVVSIRPEIAADDSLQVHLTVAGTDRERAVELVRRLEGSPQFRDARVQSEQMRGGSTGETVQFEVVASYVPQTRAEAAAAAQKETAVAAQRAGGTR